MKKTLGVLITYFNEKNLLIECIDSLLSQEEKPDEVIIYDDASESLAEKFIPKDSNIRIIRGKDRKGPAAARNKLMNTSQSDYIHFHDCDDWFRKDWCQRIRKIIEETGTDLIISEVSSYRDGDLVKKNVLGLEELDLDKEKDIIKFSIKHAILTSSTTIRRTCAVSINGYQEYLTQSEDYDFHIRLVASGLKYIIIKEPLVFQRLRKSSWSRVNRKEIWTSMTESIRLLSHKLDKKYNDELAEKLVQGGVILFRMGETTEANEAFRLASQLGQPRFDKHIKIYRILAKKFGPEFVERLRKLRTLLSKNSN